MALKINIIWDDAKNANGIDWVSHSINKEEVKQFEHSINRKQLHVINAKNNRVVRLNSSDIEVITSLGHMSQVLTFDGKTYYINTRLKELTYLEGDSLFRINQSTIINLNHIREFMTEPNSRLAVITKSNNHYLVSRHYAKKIKERLSC